MTYSKRQQHDGDDGQKHNSDDAPSRGDCTRLDRLRLAGLRWLVVEQHGKVGQMRALAHFDSGIAVYCVERATVRFPSVVSKAVVATGVRGVCVHTRVEDLE